MFGEGFVGVKLKNMGFHNSPMTTTAEFSLLPLGSGFLCEAKMSTISMYVYIEVTFYYMQ